MALQSGNYIIDTDVDNWADDATDEQKKAVIDRVEERVEKLTKDYFRVKAFDVKVSGTGSNYLNLGLIQNILTVSAVEVSGVALSTSYYEHNTHAIFLTTGTLDTEAELRYILRRASGGALFPRGRDNIRIIGTYGWTERLDIDNVSGAMEVGETITGGTSEATATIHVVESDYLKIAGRSSGNFEDDEEIEGGTSGETADVNNASGAVNDPPGTIKEACIILARYDNDPTLYTNYSEGSESTGDFSFSNPRRPLTGIREADRILFDYVRKIPKLAVV